MSISLTQPAVGSTGWGAAVNSNFQQIQDALNTGLIPGKNDFRLTLQTDTPIPTTNQANLGSIYLSPYIGKIISTYDSSVWTLHRGPELITRSGTLSSGTPVVTALSQTADLVVGQSLTGTGIPANTQILSIDSSSQITLNANATANGSQTLTFAELVLTFTTTTRATKTGNTTNGSAIVTNFGSTTGLGVGDLISGTGIPTGARIASVDSSTQITMTINATATGTGVSLTFTISVYDIFAYWDGTKIQLELSTGWTNSTTRADAITQQDGVWVKNSDPSRRLVGTVCASASNQTSDTTSQRLLWNASNRVVRHMTCADTTDSWTYTTATWRATNGTTVIGTSRVEYVCGLSEDVVRADVTALHIGSTGFNSIACGVGIDSTNATSALITGGNGGKSGSCYGVVSAIYLGYPGIGFHFFQRLEISSVGGVSTWYGDEGLSYLQTGMVAEVKA